MATAKKGLVVVESPAKAKTIQKYLGREYIVKASVGHVRDLPKAKLGVDLEKNFKVDYQMIPSKKKVIDDLKKAADKTTTLYLATDPDREGEAIAWHIKEELDLGKSKKVHRVRFNAVTKPAILEAMNNPQTLDMDRINAQQARRVLDRLVGYKISPLLWDKVKRGISAGRVQSVALRLVVDREREIKAFKSEEYWSIEARFEFDKKSFLTKLFKIDGVDPEISNRESASAILDDLKTSEYSISNVERKERTRKPQAPFITSRLQQDAARKLGFGAKRTMGIAQKLYEGVDLGDLGTHGLITYMRTDSIRVEPAAIDEARSYIGKTYGKEFLPTVPNEYKSKKSAQDAHEAIRPTSTQFSPEVVQKFLEADEFKLYCLIWNRFIASQMNPAQFDQTAIDVLGLGKSKKKYIFRATGSIIKFPGFLAAYADLESPTEKDKPEEADETTGEPKETKNAELPNVRGGEKIALQKFDPHQHFTQPPPRYGDASLIKALEEFGIGRPSTYATILSNLQDREYVEKRENRFYPSELGIVVTDLLVASFPKLLSTEFTASMETQLDEVEEGHVDWKKTLKDFWVPFEKTLEEAKKQMKNLKAQEVPTEIPCEKCGAHMNIRWGKMGSFLSCSKYPECKNTQDFTKDEHGVIVVIPKEYSDKKCKKCGNPMLIKSGKFGKFLACSTYPECKTTEPYGLGIPCPVCKEGEISERLSRFKKMFFSCNRYPDCKFAMWDRPIVKECPKCKFPIMSEKSTKKMGLIHKCPNTECGHIEQIEKEAETVT